MKTEKLSRNQIRSLEVGEIGIFELPNAKAYESARVQVSMVKRLDGLDFERVKTNTPMTVAIRRIK